ncbi:unnamed protein product [Cuscuta epithymum]|uniref:Membrane protein of ER body-like protein n=1 Tax=Cuscuta epithymum TaxID=186058 RepID=A0AAV0CFZ1_9ASTE|nr:unnamed protein product [Cuscuta epithymum]
MEVMQQFNGGECQMESSFLTDVPAAWRPGDEEVTTVVDDNVLIAEVVNNGEHKSEEPMQGRIYARAMPRASQIPGSAPEPMTMNNGSAVEEEEGKIVFNGETISHKLPSVYLDHDAAEIEGAPISSNSSAEIGNVGEIQSLVSAALRGTVDAGDSVGPAEDEDEVIELEFFDSRAVDKLHATHDAYCPNCRSPISKVVLRIKRERRRVDPPPNPEKKLDLLGCLSCFRVFLPSRTEADESNGNPEEKQEPNSALPDGKCFDLHWIFGQRSRTSNPQTSVTSQPQPSHSDQGKKKPGDAHIQGSSAANTSSHPHDSNGTQNAPTPSRKEIETPSVKEMNGDAAKQKLKHNWKDYAKTTGSSAERNFVVGEGHSGKKKPGDAHIQGSGAANTSSAPHDSNGSQDAPTPSQKEFETPSPEMNGDAAKQKLKHDRQYYAKAEGSSAERNFVVGEGHSGAWMEDSKKQEPEIRDEKNGSFTNIKGRDLQIQIDESTNEARTSTCMQDPIQVTGKSGSQSIEVVKSIVYGGLAESITSLSLVSSAAASGATTLNVLTIGVANLIGGLVIMAHNFLDLHSNRPAEEYQEVLGQRKDFPLHLIVAVLSYLTFGLTPPAIYGFAFRERDDRDMKLLMVAVASFVCIIFLAIGRAYTRRANTFKDYLLTVLQYIIVAAMASGVAYAVGHLFGRLMDELGWFDSAPTNPSSGLLLSKVQSEHLNWDSY